MRAWYNDALDDERFNVFIADSLGLFFSKEEVLVTFPRDSLVRGKEVRRLNYQGLLKVEYREPEDWEYPGRAQSRYGRNRSQQTYMNFRDSALNIYENGYYSDPFSVYLTGYLVWRETISNMVPLGHEVVRRVKGGKKKGP